MANATLMKFLNPDFHSCPPTDVRFTFKEQDGVIKDVKAHKMILASVSDVFYREFYGSLPAESDIEIKDSYHGVFLTMIEFIYNKKPNFKDTHLEFLSALYYLADKYNIEELRNGIVASIPEHDITKDNVLDVALLAEDNIPHQPISEALYDVSARFVKQVEGSEDELFAAENEKHSVVVFKLMSRAKKMRLSEVQVASVVCQDCLHCTRGEIMTQSHCMVCPAWKELRAGLELTNIKDLVMFFKRLLEERAKLEKVSDDRQHCSTPVLVMHAQ